MVPTLGAAYHPERLPEESWPADIRLMRQAHVHVVELGGSAWPALQPTPGELRFEWLDRLLDLLAAAEMQAVLATPAGRLPAWLHDPEPHLRPVDSLAGCLNDETLQGALHRLLAAMAAHCGGHVAVIGWRLSLPPSPILRLRSGQGCECERCQDLFQNYLSQRNDSLADLNHRLAATGAALAVTGWRQVRIAHARQHPLLHQEHQRFRQVCRQRFLAGQETVLRPALPDSVWITRGWPDPGDDMGQPLEAQEQIFPTLASRQDLARFRQQADAAGSPNIVHLPIRVDQDLGLARLRAWQALAHGAELLLIDRWRTRQPIPVETSVLDAGGQPRPIYDEMRWLGSEIERVHAGMRGVGATGGSPARAGGRHERTAEVAILYDEHSEWYVDGQDLTAPVTYVQHLLHYAGPFARLNIPAEFVAAGAALQVYDLVVAPALAVLPEALAAQLEDYVRRGGRLVLAGPCGLVDENLRPAETRPPGPLAAAAGVQAAEFYWPPQPAAVQGNWFSGASHPWAALLRPRDEQVVVAARYGPGNGWLDDQAAITVCAFGRGLVYTVGAYLDDAAQLELLRHIAATANLQPVMDAPAGVEVRRCVYGPEVSDMNVAVQVEVRRRLASLGREVWFVFNHRLQEQSMALPWPAVDLIGGGAVEGELRLIPYGVAVLARRD